MRTVALIGDPVAHSLSPAMHQAGFTAAGLDLDYVAERVPLQGLREAFPDLRRRHLGLNVTRPLKEAILPHLNDVDAVARRIGSVNTVVFRDGRAIGHSTDGEGFLAALRGAGAPAPRRALILGTGGAARAVAAALADTRTLVEVAGRNRVAGRRLAKDVGATFVVPESLPGCLEGADLLVNATPVGGPGHEGSRPLPDGAALHAGLTVVDLVSRPEVTPLLEIARTAGCRIVPGVEMLVEQGARSFELWTGAPAPVDVMRAAAREALAEVPA